MATAITTAVAYAPSSRAAARHPPSRFRASHHTTTVGSTAPDASDSTPGWLRIVIVSRPASTQKAGLDGLRLSQQPTATASEKRAKNSPNMLGVIPQEKMTTEIGIMR